MEALGEASSHNEMAGGGSFGGTELTFAGNQRAIIARLLIYVLTGLGGALQEDQQPALCKKSLRETEAPFSYRLRIMSYLSPRTQESCGIVRGGEFVNIQTKHPAGI